MLACHGTPRFSGDILDATGMNTTIYSRSAQRLLCGFRRRENTRQAIVFMRAPIIYRGDRYVVNQGTKRREKRGSYTLSR